MIGVIRCVPNFSLRARHNGSTNVAGHVDHAFELCVPPLEVILFAACHLKFLLLQIVERDLTLIAAVCESRIILKPVDVDDLTAMALALLIMRTVDRVEVEKPSLRSITSGKHVTTMAKLDLIAVLHRKAVVVEQ